jgi:hypothetical protein
MSIHAYNNLFDSLKDCLAQDAVVSWAALMTALSQFATDIRADQTALIVQHLLNNPLLNSTPTTDGG